MEILQDGVVLYTVDPTNADNQLLEITYADRSNTVQILNGRIRVLEAECPDQTCVHMGFLAESGLPIVCLPNHLVIQYADTEVDGTTG